MKVFGLKSDNDHALQPPKASKQHKKSRRRHDKSKSNPAKLKILVTPLPTEQQPASGVILDANGNDILDEIVSRVSKSDSKIKDGSVVRRSTSSLYSDGIHVGRHFVIEKRSGSWISETMSHLSEVVSLDRKNSFRSWTSTNSSKRRGRIIRETYVGKSGPLEGLTPIPEPQCELEESGQGWLGLFSYAMCDGTTDLSSEDTASTFITHVDSNGTEIYEV